MRNGCRTAVLLFTGDTRREERRKRLPRRLLATMHARIARIAGTAGDLFVCGDARDLPFVRGTFEATGTIAEQVSRAVDAVLACGYTRVMLLAGDVAGLEARHLAAAERVLAVDARRAVIGACRDGGFYLAAFNAEPRLNWHALPWFGATIAAELTSRLANDGFTVAQLDMLDDIDDLEDARRVVPSLLVVQSFDIPAFTPLATPVYAPLHRRPPPPH
jgi:glycosyltransferase A (GT-A) superfamily protein (DUF2064 family)